MASRFAGFPPEGLRFLRSLARNNEREWFQPRKEQYDKLVRGPMLELVAELNRELAKFAPEYITEPKEAVFRIYRDTRFSADKTPYKTNSAAWFHRRNSAGGFYLSISYKQADIGGGVYHPDREVTLALRHYIADHHEELRRLLKSRKLVQLCGELKGDELSRAPKGFDPEHAGIDLIKKKDWLLHVTLPPEVAESPELVDEIVSRFRVIHPVVEFLNRPLVGKKQSTFFE